MSLVRSRKPFYVTLSGVFVVLIIYVVLKKIHNRIRNVSNPIHGRRTLHTFSSDTNHIERLDNEVLVNSERIRVEYKNLSVTIKSSGTRKRILDSIDGSIESKKLYALIGGSGKSNVKLKISVTFNS
jgi:ABC-type microcin C transport system duplicated ATPase subunit YejF